MVLADISIWGILVVLVVLACCVGLLFVADRRMLPKIVRTLGLAAVQMAVIGFYLKGVYRLDSWIVDLLWLLIMVGLVAWMGHVGSHKTAKGRLLLPMAGALLGGCVVAGGALMLCFKSVPPRQLFVPVMGVVLSGLWATLHHALDTYEASLASTSDHRLYLLANGATRLESLMPSVRRGLRAALNGHLRTLASPVVWAMPMLFCGMLLAGASPASAALSALLVAAAVFSASVVSAVLLFYLADRYLASK